MRSLGGDWLQNRSLSGVTTHIEPLIVRLRNHSLSRRGRGGACQGAQKGGRTSDIRAIEREVRLFWIDRIMSTLHSLPPWPCHTASEQSGNNFERFQDFFLKAKAIIWL